MELKCLHFEHQDNYKISCFLVVSRRKRKEKPWIPNIWNFLEMLFFCGNDFSIGIAILAEIMSEEDMEGRKPGTANCPPWSLSPFLILGFILHNFIQQSFILKCICCWWDAMENPKILIYREVFHLLSSMMVSLFKREGLWSIWGSWKDRITTDFSSWGTICGRGDSKGQR